MVEDMKKQMRRFEHLIGFKGKLDVTSRDSMKRLIAALDARYKKDVQNSIRLHRLEFFYDLVESKSRRKRMKDEEKKDVPKEKGKKKVKPENVLTKDSLEGSEIVQAMSEERVTILPKDIDDWKDLMTLAKIYYVLQHPRSEGLPWNRRSSKKKETDQFDDMDLIEWRASQMFRLRGLEEWAQRRSDAWRLAKKLQLDMDEIESDEESRELELLYEMFDPSGRKYKRPKQEEKQFEERKRRPFSSKGPLRLGDCLEDWTESYSDDSDFSGADDRGAAAIDDFPDEKEREMGEFEPTTRPTAEEESIGELFATYPEFRPYFEEIFEWMNQAQTAEEWYKLYKICNIPYKAEKFAKDLQVIADYEEESKPKHTYKGLEMVVEEEEEGEESEIGVKIDEPEERTTAEDKVEDIEYQESDVRTESESGISDDDAAGIVYEQREEPEERTTAEDKEADIEYKESDVRAESESGTSEADAAGIEYELREEPEERTTAEDKEADIGYQESDVSTESERGTSEDDATYIEYEQHGESEERTISKDKEADVGYKEVDIKTKKEKLLEWEKEQDFVSGKPDTVEPEDMGLVKTDEEEEPKSNTSGSENLDGEENLEGETFSEEEVDTGNDETERAIFAEQIPKSQEENETSDETDAVTEYENMEKEIANKSEKKMPESNKSESEISDEEAESDYETED